MSALSWVRAGAASRCVHPSCTCVDSWLFGCCAHCGTDIESRQRVKSSAPRKESMVELFGGLCFITNTTASWVFVILAIWGGVGVNVALPLFSDAVVRVAVFD